MRKAQFALGALIVALALTAQAQVLEAKKTLPSLSASIARDTRLKEEAVKKFLDAMGPVFKEQLRAGRQIELPGVGTFQVVRVTEHKDLVNGRPAVIPAKNYIEFVPVTGLNDAANAPGAVPARTVEGYEFRVNPDSTPGFKTEGKRTPGTRSR